MSQGQKIAEELAGLRIDRLRGVDKLPQLQALVDAEAEVALLHEAGGPAGNLRVVPVLDALAALHVGNDALAGVEVYGAGGFGLVETFGEQCAVEGLEDALPLVVVLLAEAVEEVLQTIAGHRCRHLAEVLAVAP